MTEQEAIEQLKCDMELIAFNPNNGEVIPVECLNDLNRATYEADKIAISALEKQIELETLIEQHKKNNNKLLLSVSEVVNILEKLRLE